MASNTIRRPKNSGANKQTRRRARKVELPHIASATDNAAPAPMMDEPLVGPKAIALKLGVPVSWVYSRAEAGDLPSFKLGHYRRFRASEVEEYLRARRSGGGR